MRTWPALDVDIRQPDDADLVQAALTDYDVTAIDESAPERWRIFFHSPEERGRAHTALTADFPNLSFTSVDVDDEDWAARSQANLRAIQIGGIIVAPPWDVPDDPGVIIIQPSMGFGTGHHATTRLCLAALQQIDLHGKTVVDIGTGSGVLALAARMRGASGVLGIDEDEDAIASARENVTLNPGVHVELQAVSLEHVVLTPFDIVLANLTGGLLMHAAGGIAALVAATGRLIISGFMHSEEVGVLASFSGFCVVERMQEDEWMCAMLQREGSFA
jgi:ribosomal protein L11 methyltransferase